MKSTIVSLLLATNILGFNNFAIAGDEAGLHIHDPWIREAPPNTKMLAAYMTIENHDNKKYIVTHITSPVFDKIEIHVSKMKDDMMMMEQRKRLVIHAGKRFVLQPGEYHLMLIGPKQALKHGDQVELGFHLENGSTIIEKAKVKRVLGSFGKKHKTKSSGQDDGHNHKH